LDSWVPLAVHEVRDHRPLLDTPEFQNQLAARYLLNNGSLAASWRFHRNITELQAFVDDRLTALQ
jgi:hypothetical protein